MCADSIKRPFVAHPLAMLASCFACGVAGARFLATPLMLCLIACAIASALAAFFFALVRERWAATLLMAAFLCAGGSLAVIERDRVEPHRVEQFYDSGLIASGDPVELTGVLVLAPEPAPEGFYLTVKASGLRFKENYKEAAGVVWLFAPVRDRVAREEYEGLELRYGARISVMVALRRAESFRNPGGSSFTEYLERRGYDATGNVKSPLLIERLEDERVFLPLAWIYEWRGRLLRLIDERFNDETAGVLKAALLGNRHYLSRTTAERFRQGGTFHILVISGLHISFIGGLCYLITRRVTRRRSWQFGVSALFLWAYTVAVGAESSVARAALMFTIVGLAPLLHRRARALNALGFAILIMLARRPYDLFDPSFQLTVLSVLAIITLAWPLLKNLKEIGRWRPTRATPHPPLCPRFVRALGEALFWSQREWTVEMEQSVYSYRLWKTGAAMMLERWHVQRLLRYSFAALVVSASVQLMLLPLLVLYFHRLPTAALILNIGVGAMMTALALLSLVALFTAELSAGLASPLIWLAEQLCWLMIHSVDPFLRAHLASIRLPEYRGGAATVYALYYLPLIFCAAFLAAWHPVKASAPSEEKRLTRFGPPLAALALAVLSAVIILHPFSAFKPDARLRVDFLDVGQGDAALVTMPDGTTLLIDAGGRVRFDQTRKSSVDEAGELFERDVPGIGEAVVSEYLWWRGLERVDYIVATHADADHLEGLNDIIRNFRVRAAFVGRAPVNDDGYSRFAGAAAERNVPLYLIARGDLLRFGEVTLEVLWPMATARYDATSGNDDSVALRLRLGQRSFLFTGDIEKAAETALVCARETLRSDVVKVAHHGSRTSSIESFVNASSPRYAIISVGTNSIYGHPHKEVLERWKANGAQILTTGRSGTITFSTDGNDLRIETFVRD